MTGRGTNATAYLTPAQVVDLRQQVADGYSSTVIAERFGLSDTRYVKWIAEGRVRADVTCEIPKWFPLCMDRDEYDLWRSKAAPRIGSWVEELHRPCDDCPLAFAADMRQLGLCNGTPGDVTWEPEVAA